MKINELKLYQYRNYPYLSISFSDNINVFLGRNAQGKTNILEAVYYAAIGRSHRTHNDQELIMWEKNQAKVQMDFSRIGVENRLSFLFRKEKRREIVYNGLNVKPAEAMGALNVVLFSPEDLMLIKGAPQERRRFLDMEISQANRVYYELMTKYVKIVQQRNAVLKRLRDGNGSEEMLDIWDEQLAKVAYRIVIKRTEAVEKLSMLANLMHRRLTQEAENLKLTYLIHGLEDSDILGEDWYKASLKTRRRLDIIRGSTSIGPHRDDLRIEVNGIDLKTFGSQGQQRTGILSLKLSELEYIKSEIGEYPILLLDDVMSELDYERRSQLLLFIKEKIQTFITATDRRYFPDFKIGKYYYIENGAVVDSDDIADQRSYTEGNEQSFDETKV